MARFRVTEVNELSRHIIASAYVVVIRVTCPLPVVIVIRIDISFNNYNISRISQGYFKTPLVSEAWLIKIDLLVLKRRRLVRLLIYYYQRGETRNGSETYSDDLKSKLQCELWNTALIFECDVILEVQLYLNINKITRLKWPRVRSNFVCKRYDNTWFEFRSRIKHHLRVRLSDWGAVCNKFSAATDLAVCSAQFDLCWIEIISRLCSTKVQRPCEQGLSISVSTTELCSGDVAWIWLVFEKQIAKARIGDFYLNRGVFIDTHGRSDYFILVSEVIHYVDCLRDISLEAYCVGCCFIW